MAKLEDMADRVYAWALKRTFSDEEAKDLSQEILYTALRELPKLRDGSRFEPWFWGVASNVTKTFRRRAGKQRAMFTYDLPEEIPELPDEDALLEEQYAALRGKIAMLSALYRNILVLFYYDGMTAGEIAARLGIPEGTVAWRLSEARRKLKKELADMEETALRPRTLKLGINGHYDGVEVWPTQFIDDALSQNLLCLCAGEPRTVEELAKATGVPAYYIEDRLRNMAERRAVTEHPRGRYGTAFLIHTDKDNEWLGTHASAAAEPLTASLLDAADRLFAEAEGIPFFRGERSAGAIRYLLLSLAIERLGALWNPLPAPEIEPNYDGQRWQYFGSMADTAVLPLMLSVHRCINPAGFGSHIVFRSVSASPPPSIMRPDMIDACGDIFRGGRTERHEAAAGCAEAGYLRRREDGTFALRTPILTEEQAETVRRLAEEFFAPTRDAYAEAVLSVAGGYRKLFPARLAKEADRECGSLFTRMFAAVIREGQRTGRLPMPDDVCDGIVAHGREAGR